MTQQLELPHVPQKDTRLSEILDLAKTLTEKERLIEETSKTLEKLSAEAKEIRERQLPDVMLTFGLTEIKMVDGRILTIKPVYYASVPKARSESAFQWLRDNAMGGIIKSEIKVSDSYKDQLIEANVPFELKESINPMTLRSFVRERIEANDTNFPRELFGAVTVNTAVFKDN